MNKEELSTKTYRELQDLAKSVDLPFVGINKQSLIDSLVTDEPLPNELKKEDRIPPLGRVVEYEPEEYHTEHEIDALRAEELKKAEEPKVTTTKNVGRSRGEEIIPKVVEFKEKMVRIRPKKDTPKSYIGNKIYQLKAHKVYEVPEEVAEIFDNGGYL